jgi:heme/copper-type cytochrome/quinol oxidase subunit 2
MRTFTIAGAVLTSMALSAAHLDAVRSDIAVARSQDAKVIRVSAERFAYTPSEIVVTKGTVIEFHLTSDDTDHGFRIVGTEVNAEIPKRRRGETVVKYTADTAGTFVIECSRPCGAGHTAMRATLVVKDEDQ